MAVSVRQATEGDLQQVYVLLSNSTLNSAWLPFEARKRMFRPNWGADEGYYGYVLEDDGTVVGFLGLLFTKRPVNGHEHRFCEWHSWYVKEEYRKESMKLLLPAMSVRDATHVNYTPTETVYEISKKFGFGELETTVRAFFPVPTPRSLLPRVRVERRKHVLVQHLDAADRKIFFDHEGVECEHFLITPRDGSGYAYVILKRMWLRRFVPFGRIIYVSDRRIFLDAVDYLKLYWCLRLRLYFIAIDQDEIAPGRRLWFTRKVKREVPSLYKSKDLGPQDIKPPLYTLPLLLGYRLH